MVSWSSSPSWEFPTTVSGPGIDNGSAPGGIWIDLDDYMESDEAKNHEQGHEYIVKFRKVSGNNKDGEGYIK